MTSYKTVTDVNWLLNDNKVAVEYIQTEDGIKRQVQFSEISDAIKSNRHLTKEEKEFFLSNPKFFEDNASFWDYETVLNTLKNLKIVYTKEDDPTVAGYYNWTGEEKNTIKFYESKKFSDVPKYLVSHEFLHTFTNFSNNSFNNLYEIVNVVFNNEYFSQGNLTYDYTYHNLTKYLYVLAEIIEPDVLRKYHANNDINYIIEALGEIIPNQNTALSLLQDIDFLGKLNLLTQEEQLALSEEAKLRDKMITSTLEKYYEAKYQSSIVDNYNALYWLNKDLCFTKLSAELGFQDDVMLAADDYTEVVQYKKLFNLTGQDDFTLLIPSAVSDIGNNNYKPIDYLKYQIPYQQTNEKTL